MKNKSIAIIGTVGLPANYGGFETLVENLARYHDVQSIKPDVTLYCSGKSYTDKKENFLSINLKYIPLQANGVQSIPYDMCSLLSAIWNRHETILLLGVSGAIILPLIRCLSSVRIITNIDGIEWRRQKWKGLAKWFLKFSEKMAVRFSHEIIADNSAIAEYVQETYYVDTHVIAYGGDHTVNVASVSVDELQLPEKYAFSVCRIEPENNIHLIVAAFAKQIDTPLVIVGNWESCAYGQQLKMKYSHVKHVFLLDPIYDLGKLYTLRSQAQLYVHGHSAGGTNPSLVEAMHFSIPVLAFDCSFNRYSTKHKAKYFRSEKDLLALLSNKELKNMKNIGLDMLSIAEKHYTWETISQQYFDLLKVRL